MSTRRIVIASIISALYMVFTVATNPISFGPVQFRVSNVLMALMLFDIDFCVGLSVGVFLGNLSSPFGILDWAVMPIISFCASIIAYKLRERWFIGILTWAIITSIGVAVFPLGIGAQLPIFLTFPSVFISQIVTGCIGYSMFHPFEKQIKGSK